ncbi:MAG: response regulator transcription factor [Lewinellaceae bacterium]|nr:response regulator transcription factor [Phaeodactylibacter sp.]MCB9041026.1 response regulator transcription factor [Lewinellaceae bacterium]
MVEIMIADDHRVFREGMVSILENTGEIKVVAQAQDGKEVMEKLKQVKPELILMDISMGEAGGIETTRLVKEHYPDVRVLVLSMHSESSYIVKMLEAGASGYLLKDAGSAELINAIKAVAGGHTYFSSQVSATLVDQLVKGKKPAGRKEGVTLTRREVEVLRLIAEEFSNSEIADKLFISIRTVDTHRRNLLEKLGVKNTAGLVKYAIKHGLAEG